MASAVLANGKDEMTCPICLELMSEPMTIDYGHSFCQACITSNTDSTTGPGVESRCPLCQISFKFENSWPNRQIANIAHSLRNVRFISPEQNVHHCAWHGEKLQLFCKEDGQVICWLCERSQQHRSHHTYLVEEAAQEYQNTLQESLKELKNKKEESEKWKAELLQGKTSCKAHIQGKIRNVQEDFIQLRGILDSEEEKILQKWKKEEEDGMKTLEVSEKELTQKSNCVTRIISDVELQLEKSTVEMLQDVNAIIRRCELLTMNKPITFPEKEQTLSPVTGLRGMLQVFQELSDACKYYVHVTVATNEPRTVISKDGRQIRYLSLPVYSNEIFSTFSHNYFFNLPVQSAPLTLGACQYSNKKLPPLGVLGSPEITTGKHYWTVDVSKITYWCLGLSDGRQFRPMPRPDVSVYEIPRPKNGYWIIEVKNKSKVVLGEDPATNVPLSLPLSLPVALDHVGVLVDRQAGSVSFYSITYPAFLIYKFTNCSFPHKVYPYFNPLQCPEPMTLC
ncbi:LOW QUALITY PROTEIN: tripartite motif-containing protein 5-like [Thomomys bottae]